VLAWIYMLYGPVGKSSLVQSSHLLLDASARKETRTVTRAAYQKALIEPDIPNYIEYTTPHSSIAVLRLYCTVKY
jgi:hypothetical protein